MPELAHTAAALRSGRPCSLAPPAPLTTAPVRPLPVGQVYLGAAKEIGPTLRDCGIDPGPVITAAGLDPRLLDDSAGMISHQALGRLLTLSVARARCPCFGLLVGRRATIFSLGLVGRLMLHSKTLGDALQSLVDYLGVQDRVAVPSLEVAGDTAVLGFAVYQSETESADQIIECTIAGAVNTIRALVGPDWAPAEVLLPRARPVDAAPYRRHFRAPVRFNQELAALVIPRPCLELRIAGADPMVRALLEERIEQVKSSQGSEFSDDIRRLLRTRLTSSRCSADKIAKLLTMHRRTLSRRLKDSGMGYRAISNEMRFEIARQLLEDTEVPLGQVAAALGYSEASAFTRAFRRWSGETPKAWRAGHRCGGERSSQSPGASTSERTNKGRQADEPVSDHGISSKQRLHVALQPVPAQVAS